LLNYQDERVKVHHQNSDQPYNIQTIFDVILHQNKLLPYKATCHYFSPSLPIIGIDLSMLR
ncbi:hypothetical protein ACWB34_004145, partial [Providencia stuartii]